MLFVRFLPCLLMYTYSFELLVCGLATLRAKTEEKAKTP